jgi:transposase
MAAWLVGLGVKVVALEATGVYWIAPYEVLERHGLEVHLVDSRSCNQVRKSDVLDCQWIQRLMSYGLLRAAFRPADEWCVVRSYVRQQAALVRDQTRSIQQMQKALTQMNLQLANVLSDITGKTGMAILRAIVAGERDGEKLAQLRDRRVKADQATIARSLTGNWREEHLYALAQALGRYDFFAAQIAECEERILASLERLPAANEEPPMPLSNMRPGRPHRSRAHEQRLREALQRALGVDLTAIPTIATNTALVIATELGRDLSRFPDSAHFCSWANVAPPTRISGGKPLGGKGSKAVNRVGEALKLAAVNARRSDSFIGAAHRARLMRMDKATAVKATAHQLARLIYAMLTKGQPYVEKGIEHFEQDRRHRQRRAIERRARALGFALVPAA